MAVNLLKKYPLNYSEDVVNIINMMSFTDNVLILGSSSLKAQKYASDYDGYEDANMNSINDIIKKFKSIVSNLIKQPNTFITDIKCGTFDLFKVIPDDMTPNNYKKLKPSMITKLKTLFKDNVITKTELNESLLYLKKDTIDLYEVEVIKKEIRFNILRWKPEDILKGKINYRGYDISLKFALQTPIFSKIDVVSWVENNRYTDFSIIYVFSVKGKIINKGLDDFVTIVKKNIIVLLYEENYFKVAKRIFALARYIKPIDDKTLNILSKLFNSDLGIIYQVKGDIGTIESIITIHKKITNTLKIEFIQMINRLSHVVIPSYLDKEYNILKEINLLIKDPYNIKLIEKIQEQLQFILNNESLKYLKDNGLYPIPNKYLLKQEDTEQNKYNELLYFDKGKGMVIPKKDLIKEHKVLIPILKKGTKQQRMKEALKQEKEMAKLQQEKGDGIKDVLKYGAKKALTLANRVTKILPSSDKNARDGWDDEKHGILLLPNGKFGRANYMGPGTHLMQRLKRGDPPRTAMDELSMYHDIRYSLAKSQDDIAKADEIYISGAKYILKNKLDNAVNVNLGLRPIQLKYIAEKKGIIKPIIDIEVHTSQEDINYLKNKLSKHPIGLGMLKRNYKLKIL